MNTTAIKTTWARSTWAVFAGILANFVIAIPIDTALHAIGIFPPDRPLTNGLCALALSYRVIAALTGGYITARLAPRYPTKHALALGVIGFLMSTAGTVAMWQKGPHWYPLMLIAISIPGSLAGARFFQG